MPEGSDITSVDDLAGKIVGAQDATTGEAYANDETDAVRGSRLPRGPGRDRSAVITGQVDAAIIDQPVAVDAVEKQGGIEIAAEIPTNELYGIALSKDNPGLLDAVDGALQRPQGRRDDHGAVPEVLQDGSAELGAQWDDREPELSEAWKGRGRKGAPLAPLFSRIACAATA